MNVATGSNPTPNEAPMQPIPFAESALPLEACGFGQSFDAFERSVFELLRRGNLPQAELLLRMQLGRHGESARGVNCLGWIATAAGLPGDARRYFARAAALLPQARLNFEALQRRVPSSVASGGAGPRLLLAKAWGFGFWSDVSHVLGQLLVAELTGRQPVVHWGPNSLFWDGSLDNAFDAYFEPVSHATPADALRPGLTIWPPKWNRENLLGGEMHNKWSGAYSRVAGIHLLGRQENLIVADFHCSVLELLPWIPADSPLRPLNIDELHAFLIQKYLRPAAWLQTRVAQLHAALLNGAKYIAVHARGSDKIKEFPHIESANREYMALLDAFRAEFGIRRIFLMTDDMRLQKLYRAAYGDDVICTECQRTDNFEGVHYQEGRDRRLLGAEVMVDAYLAARADAFIGNGFSNVSLQVSHMKRWPAGSLKLIGPRMTHLPNPGLHRW